MFFIIKNIEFVYFNFVYGVGNLIKWLPIIWSDRDWDYSYLMNLLSFKMSNMSKLHRDYGSSVSTYKTMRELKEASVLAKKISDEDYIEELFGDEIYLYYKRDVQFDFEEGYFEEKGLSDGELIRYKEIINQQDKYLERDIEALFNLMRKELRNWWD